MNLLPPEIIKKRQCNRLYIKMAAIQAVIFLSLILLVWCLDVLIVKRDTQIVELGIKLQDARFAESENLAQAVRENIIGEFNRENILDEIDLPYFNVNRVKELTNTLPVGVRLIYFDTDAEAAVLTAQTSNLSLADVHRDAWIATGLVEQVRLASANSLEGGVIQYVLNIVWLCEN